MGCLCPKKTKKRINGDNIIIKELQACSSDNLNYTSDKQPTVNNNFGVSNTHNNSNSNIQVNNYINNNNNKGGSLRTKSSFKKLGTKEIVHSNSLNVTYKTFIKPKTYTDLLKDYDLLEHLGAGAFGIVQKVRHKQSGQIRAMKIIQKYPGNDEKSLKEIDNLLLLDHPNILKLYAFYYNRKNVYVITEYCQGGELFDKIKDRGGLFSEKDAAIILKAVFQAIAYCHSMKLVHRDLKPENILLEGNELDNIKLIDFGTSTIINPKRKFKKRLGTAYYMAPEVLKKSYDEKCDIWSIGVIMHILLTGEPPFNGQNDDEIIEKVKDGSIDLNKSLFNEISEEAKNLLEKLLEKDPQKRLSALDALDHSWIKNQAPHATINEKVAKQVFDNLRSFQADQKLQEAAVAFIVNQLITKEETEELKKMFIELDKNCDGVLSREEIEMGLMSQYGAVKAKEETEAIFQKVDSDQNGFISYDEFIRASIDKTKILTEEKLKAAYKLFDKNGDGNIEAKEIKEVLGKDIQGDDNIWRKIVKEVDLNGDGTINYDEFKAMMEKIVSKP